MTRRTRGRALSEAGKTAVRAEIAKRGWSRQYYAHETELSLSTVGRCLRGVEVDMSSLSAALGVLGLEVDSWVIQRKEMVPPQYTTTDTQTALDTYPGFFMYATFDKNKRIQIERAIQALQTLLIGSRVLFHQDGEQVTITGSFAPERKREIEATIRHLELLFESCTVTGEIECAGNDYRPLATVL